MSDERYPTRSWAVPSAEREKRDRLARELEKLDKAAEQRMADEGLGDESWSQD